MALLVCVALTLSTHEFGVHAATSDDAESTKRILAIFGRISQIPRCSKHEQGISAWLVDWAKQRSFVAKSDDLNNVLIFIPASPGYQNHPTVALQAHMDMVCQKSSNSRHDFTKDPITLIRNGDWLRAADTTLGADDGIGIAIALALAEDPKVAHPSLNLLFTADEEIDMTGAQGLSKEFLSAHRLINLDSETEGIETLGAAGGIKTEVTLPVTFSMLPPGQSIFSLRIDGLMGGHSGLDIGKGRPNANVLIAQALPRDIPFRMINFSGGSAANVITRTSEMLFAVPQAHASAITARIAAFEREVRGQYPAEENLSITLTPVMSEQEQAASELDSAKLVKLVLSIPQGVIEWSKDFAGLPETSNNIGIVETGHNALRITTFQRSFDPNKLLDVAHNIETAATKAGAGSERRSTFPAWTPNPDSDLYRKSLAAYKRLFNAALNTDVTHAGLECGYFAQKQAGIEIVSIGPTLEDVHTPKERLDVPSSAKVWRFLKELMQTL